MRTRRSTTFDGHTIAITFGAGGLSQSEPMNSEAWAFNLRELPHRTLTASAIELINSINNMMAAVQKGAKTSATTRAEG